MKKTIMSGILFLLISTPAMAVDTTQTYNSGILVLLFVGFCALIIVAQLIPAILSLFGMTKTITKNNRKTVSIKS